MATSAPCRRRFVVGLVLVTRDARGTIVSWRRLVRAVTGRAIGVPLAGVQGRSLVRGMTRRAGRRRCDAVRTMGAVTARAGDLRSMSVLGFCRVARRARLVGLACTAVRVVAARAVLMTSGRRALLGGVTARAGRWRATRFVRSALVAARAVAVAGVARRALRLGGVTGGAGWDRSGRLVGRLGMAVHAGGVAAARCCPRFGRVALRAQRPRERRCLAVLVMAVEAVGGRVVRLLMAALARDRELTGRERVRRMATDTIRVTGRRGVVDTLGRMARPARRGFAAIVRGMATRARGVFRRGEHRLSLVARGALGDGFARECMRGVAAGAPRVSGRDGVGRDARGAA